MNTTVTVSADRRTLVTTTPDGDLRIEIPTEPDNTRPRTPLIGANVALPEYKTWHPKLPGIGYARVFYKAGAGLPHFGKDPAITKLPPSVRLIGVSHKDKPRPAELAASWDTIAAGTQVEWIFHHEAQGDPITPRAYLADWQIIRACRDAHPRARQITLTNILNLYACRWKADVNWREWMLPDLADRHGWDCYRLSGFNGYEPPESLLGLPIAAAKEFGVRWSLPELGAHLAPSDESGRQRAQWYRDTVTYAGQHGCEVIGLWSTRHIQNGTTYEYRPNDEPTLTAWQDLMARNEVSW